MDVVTLTRTLVDIESITGNEAACGIALESILQGQATRHKGTVERLPVEGDRFNLYVSFGDAGVTFSTHYDTVPPFIPSAEDETKVYGRGSCDAKGILASMVVAAERLLEAGHRDLALLFVVGEERGSAGAYAAERDPRPSRFLINGEPTENQLGQGTKGALRLDVVAKGKMAHSAYPELGDSAIDKLLDALERIRRIELPNDAVLGPSTLNIGTLSGGRATNVIPDEAKAELLIRLVSDPRPVVEAVQRAAGCAVEVVQTLCIPALHLTAPEGFPTTVVKYTTDVPILCPAWGEPLLVGPGTIHVAHTPHEHILKADLHRAVDLYVELATKLLAGAPVE